MSAHPICRSCGASLETVFVDLGMSPPSNALIDRKSLSRMERFYPLRAFVCGVCFLVQLEEFESPSEIFSDYAYFSSYSTTWLEHCRQYANRMIGDLMLGDGQRVVEIASNDGYLLQYFRQQRIDVLGIEPAANVAKVATERGIPTEVAFFGEETAKALSNRGVAADLLVANNVLAHVPNIHDFVEGVRILLAPSGTATFEFPHLAELIDHNQFDTIYHEHFSYLSILATTRIFEAHGLAISRIERIPTHGGSLRVWVRHKEKGIERDASVDDVIGYERSRGLSDLHTYVAFGDRVETIKRRLLQFLIKARDRGQRLAAYGAAAKGTTLFNYCGVRTDFIDYIADRNPYKQGRFLPGCHVPVVAPERIDETRPQCVLIIPWNIKDEISEQLKHVRAWGAQFAVAIPTVEVF
jgi:SAM-dependent methyltransferase